MSNGAGVPASASQAIEQFGRGYDAEVKNFLKEKQVLAVILKSCVSEFKGSSLEDIANKYYRGNAAGLGGGSRSGHGSPRHAAKRGKQDGRIFKRGQEQERRACNL